MQTLTLAPAARTLRHLAERTFGISISRHGAGAPNQHADNALRYLRRWSREDVVFDVGANDGRTVLRLNEPLGRPRILAFEPVSSTYQTLVARTRHLPNVRTFPLALGAAPGSQAIYLHEIGAMNSFSPHWGTSPEGTEVVPISTVDAVMAEQGIDFVHFLKVDTEGYELEVLRGAEAALRSSRIAIIQLEVGVDQIAKPMFSLEEARRYLAERGYLLQGVYNQCRTRATAPPPPGTADTPIPRAEVLAYCDALFLRADLPEAP
jgi:FkbM family methyltransferase